MSAPQAAAITACTACAAVGGAAAGGAFSSGTSVDTNNEDVSGDTGHSTHEEVTVVPPKPTETKWYPVTEEENDNKSSFTETNKIGKVYEKYLVGSYGKASQNNQEWWTQSFNKYLEDKKIETSTRRQFSSEFSEGKVSSAFETKNSSSGDKDKALNRVCLKIYGQDKTTITSSSTGDNQSKLKEDLWRYCSPLGETPKTISDVSGEEADYNSGNNKIGKTKKTFLLSVKDNNNSKLWDLKDKEFKALSTSESPYFKKRLDEVKDVSISTPKTLKEVCKAAYLLESAAESTEPETKPKDTNVVKYCSLLGSETN